MDVASSSSWDVHDASACPHADVAPAQWDAFVARHTTPAAPEGRQKVIMMVGLPGSGKTGTRALCTVLSKEREYTLIDPDMILETFFANDRRCYPQVDRLQERWRDHCVARRANIILDGTGKNLVPKIEAFSGWGDRVLLCVNLADIDLCKQRVALRELQTQRAVTPGFVDAVHERLKTQLGVYLHHKDVEDIWMYANDATREGRRAKLCHGKAECRRRFLVCPARATLAPRPLKRQHSWLEGNERLLHVHHTIEDKLGQLTDNIRKTGPRVRITRNFGIIEDGENGWIPVRKFSGPYLRAKYERWANLVAPSKIQLQPLPDVVQPRKPPHVLVVPLDTDFPAWTWETKTAILSPFTKKKLGASLDAHHALQRRMRDAIVLFYEDWEKRHQEQHDS